MEGLTLPPRTSSPMIKQAAVLILRLVLSPLDAMMRDAMGREGRAAEVWR